MTDHVAIMKKSWGLTQKILTGQKKIESRWYKARYPPWGKIKTGDIVYFKDSGAPITIKAEVDRVLQFDNLTPNKIKEILDGYGEHDGLEASDLPRYFELFKDKKYCMLIFLRNVQKTMPFEIDKTGFGTMAAWLTMPSIDAIRRRAD